MKKKMAEPVTIGIRHGDMVRIMAGRAKGKSGKVLSVNRLKNTVTVEHANIRITLQHRFGEHNFFTGKTRKCQSSLLTH